MQEPSEKNTKNEILKAYNDLLKKVQEEKTTDRKTEKKREEEKEVITHAGEITVEGVVNRLAALKLDIGKSLEDVEDKLTTEYKRFAELRQAVEIEKKNLQEIHEITLCADSLVTLLRAQKEKKIEFEQEIEEEKHGFEEEMEQRRLEWKKEQDSMDLAIKERKIRTEKDRKQEEDDYLYNTQKKRKLEEDTYISKKASQEKELAEKKQQFERDSADRERAIVEREKEYQELKIKAETFPQTLQKAITETEVRITGAIEIKYKHQADLLTKEIEGERKLNQQMVSTLEAKIREKDELIKQLTLKVNDSGKQVQDIALKAIEGATRPTIIREVSEKNTDNGKQEIRNR
jgi:hypothetical protein